MTSRMPRSLFSESCERRLKRSVRRVWQRVALLASKREADPVRNGIFIGWPIVLLVFLAA